MVQGLGDSPRAIPATTLFPKDIVRSSSGCHLTLSFWVLSVATVPPEGLDWSGEELAVPGSWGTHPRQLLCPGESAATELGGQSTHLQDGRQCQLREGDAVGLAVQILQGEVIQLLHEAILRRW